MGNSPSTSKPTTPYSSARESPKLAKREPKIIGSGAQNQRVAVPPEQPMTQATDSNAQSRSAPNFPSASDGGPDGVGSPASIPGGEGGGMGTSTSLTGVPSASTRSTDDEPSKPVAVPLSSTEPSSLRSHHSLQDDVALENNESLQDMSYLTKPPRLPLPIEEELHTPGSPITAPQGGTPLEDIDTLNTPDGNSRKLSVVSTSTQDTDEEELRVDRTKATVPTRLEWTRGGEKIYLTGTVFSWNRKMRLHPVEGRPGVFSGMVQALPGTHHIRFLVDGIMTTCPDLPTTVDFGNNLVNYIDVHPKDQEPPATPDPSELKDGEEVPRKRRQAPSRDMYVKEIAPYLLDYDQTEENEDYLTGMIAVDKLGDPPSLPSFLTKPILNHSSLLKDDNSVLTMPNHTVLNHLATSSIKHNILAVSATTRYRNKYVTTITYKPADD